MAVAPTVVPALNMIRPAVKAGARALGPTAVSMGEGYLQRQGLMPGVVPETPGTPLSNMVLDLNKPLSEQSFGVQNALMGKAEYRGGHTAPLKNSGAPLHDLTGGGTVYPDDVYSNTAARYYGAGDPQSDSVLFSKLQSLRNKPDEMVDVWRAVPSEVFKQNSGKQPAFQHGDWVTISRKYAVEHGEGALNGDYKLMRAKFPAKALFTNGDSPYEAGLDLSVLGRNFNDPKMTGSDVVKSFNDPEKAANALSRQGITGIKREPGGITLSTGMQDNNQPVQQAMNEFEQSLINFMATPAK